MRKNAPITILGVLWLSFCLGVGCKSGDSTTKTDNSGDKTKKIDVFSPSQPEYPAEGDDPFFTAEAVPMEVFRVLVTRGNYSVRQVGQKEIIKRKPDPNGDKEQLANYQQFHERYDFKDWALKAVLSVRINPHNGEIEHAEYVPGKNPRSWQASRFFQEDIQRFAFTFPKNAVLLREFWITFEFRINRREGMSDAEAKRRAVEFLKQQLD